ncbi:uncharacterized [Tachysurus ichikawai]
MYLSFDSRPLGLLCDVRRVPSVRAGICIQHIWCLRHLRSTLSALLEMWSVVLNTDGDRELMTNTRTFCFHFFSFSDEVQTNADTPQGLLDIRY